VNRRGFLRASTATAVLAALPISTAVAIALDPMATVIDPRTTIYAKLVDAAGGGRMFIQGSLAYFEEMVSAHLDAGYEIAYLDVEPMPTEIMRS